MRGVLRLVSMLLCIVALGAGCVTNDRQMLIRELRSLGYDVRESAEGVVVFLPDVLFAFDSAELTPAGSRKVQGVADLIDRLTVFDSASIEGHTDSVGDETYNLFLSENRARSVARALVASGIPSDRLEVTGFGESRPLYPETTPSGRFDSDARRLNRRVEMILRAP